MWEAIAANRRRSRILILVMGMLLMALGGMIGMSVDPEMGWAIGLAVAFAIWLIMYLTAMYSGDSILLSTAGARRIEKKDCPVLYNIVEEMCLASGLVSIPAIYITEDKTPNAFAVGRTPEKAAVVVTMGLLRRLDRDELQGVVAHELGHVKNLDIRFMTLAAVMVGSIAMISDVFLRSMRYSGHSRYRSSGKGKGNAQALIFVITIVLAILAPIVAQMLYFACSRKREYLADASAARYTRYPDGLASALEKIGGSTRDKATNECKARNIAPLYIVNPLQAVAGSSIFSTHPPIERRVNILRSMVSGASFADYEAAYRKTLGERKHCLGERSLADSAPVNKRPPSPEAKKTGAMAGSIFTQLEPVREALDHLAVLNQFIIIPCVCGMRLKLPPDYSRPTMKCPRCGKSHDVPSSVENVESPDAPHKSMAYQRKGNGWEIIPCRCGAQVNLSPNFSGTKVRCPRCNADIRVIQ